MMDNLSAQDRSSVFIRVKLMELSNRNTLEQRIWDDTQFLLSIVNVNVHDYDIYFHLRSLPAI
jgi:hypothetical protein